VSEKPFDIRTPSALLLASFKPLTKLVWIAVRSYQGQGKYCKASLETIGKRVINQKGNPTDKSRISGAIKELEKAGWIEDMGRLKLRCLVPEKVAKTATNPGNRKLRKPQQVVANPATSDKTQSCESSNGKLRIQQQKVAKFATRTENLLLKPTSKTKDGAAPLLQSFNPDEESVEKQPQKYGTSHLHFLAEKERVYEPSILAALKAYPPDFIQQAFIALMKGSHRGTTPTESLLALREKHGHVKLMAALVLGGNEGIRGNSSLKFLAGILNTWAKAKVQPGKSTPTSQNQNQTWQPAKLDDMSFLDEPIQTPAR